MPDRRDELLDAMSGPEPDESTVVAPDVGAEQMAEEPEMAPANDGAAEESAPVTVEGLQQELEQYRNGTHPDYAVVRQELQRYIAGVVQEAVQTHIAERDKQWLDTLERVLPPELFSKLTGKQAQQQPDEMPSWARELQSRYEQLHGTLLQRDVEAQKAELSTAITDALSAAGVPDSEHEDGIQWVAQRALASIRQGGKPDWAKLAGEYKKYRRFDAQPPLPRGRTAPVAPPGRTPDELRQKRREELLGQFFTDEGG